MKDLHVELRSPPRPESWRGAWARLITSPRFAPVLLASLVIWEFGALLLKAGRTRFWYDELVTFHVSGLQPFTVLWSALQAGVDGIPPGYYAIVQLGRMLPGDPHITLRLPSLFGYLLTLLGVYWFARKRLPAVAGLVAVLLITVSPFRAFATEARPYALLTGLLAIAAVLWQRIGENRFMPALFALALTLAVACHSLVVVAISCFGIAEITRTVQSRRIRWGVWIACLAATIPFFLSLPTLLHFRAVFGPHFWARPNWGTALSTYRTYFGLSITLALALVAFFAIAVADSLPRIWRRSEEARPEGDFHVAEIVLIGGFVFYPAFLVVLTRSLGSGYAYRYGWPAIIGLALGSVYLLRSMWRRPSSAHFVAALMFAFVVQGGIEFAELPKAGSTNTDERWARLTELSRDRPDFPVVIGNGLRYLEAASYAPPELRNRLVQVVDPDLAVRLTGADTVDLAGRILARFIPLRVEELASFQAAHQRFMLYSDGDRLDWFTGYLADRKYRLTLLSRQAGRAVYFVER